MNVLTLNLMELLIFVLCGVDVFCCINLFIDWGNPSNNLSGYIDRFGETHLNWFLEFPHLIWQQMLLSN